MPWVILLVSAAFEALWATALGRSNGLTQWGPTVVFVAGLAASMGGLALAMRQIPVSVAYAVWVGGGGALTVTYAMATGDEEASVAKVILLSGIIACTIGLTFLKSPSGRDLSESHAHDV